MQEIKIEDIFNPKNLLNQFINPFDFYKSHVFENEQFIVSDPNSTMTTQEDRLRPDVEIILIGQKHRTGCDVDLLKNEISKSQFLILKEIQNHPNALVFMEGYAVDFTPQSRDPLLATMASLMFPSNNIPDDYNQLNEEQKESLYNMDGVSTAYLLGFVDTIHKTITSQERELIDLQVRILQLSGELLKSSDLNKPAGYHDFTPKGQELVYHAREALLQKEIVEVTNQPENKGKEVIIVFGAGHIETLSKRFKDNITSIIDLSNLDK